MGGLPTVVVLVAAGGSAEPTTLAIERATSQALGHAAQVVVREAMGAPTDGEALTIGSEANEAAVVQVIWNDRGHRVATLRVYLARRWRWIDRTIGFSAADAAPERGRTIGLALATMLPDPDLTPARQELPAPQEAQPQAAARAPGAAPDAAETPPYEAPVELQDRAPAAPRGSSPRGPHYAMDFVGLGAAALGSDVQTAGGGAAFEMFLTPGLALRIGGAVRTGDVAGATVHALTLLASAGVELHPWPTTNSRVLGASLRVDYVLMDQIVTLHAAGSADLSTGARRLSGMDAFVEVQWRLAANFDVLAGLGVEEMFATTMVDLNGTRMATLPPVSLVAEGGLRLRF